MLKTESPQTFSINLIIYWMVSAAKGLHNLLTSHLKPFPIHTLQSPLRALAQSQSAPAWRAEGLLILEAGDASLMLSDITLLCNEPAFHFPPLYPSA